jgi:CRISPR-associated protein Csm4
VFSALCQEALRQGHKEFQMLLEAVREDRVRISDALPYIGDRLYVPKPMIDIETAGQSDSIVKKAVKKLEYLPIDGLQEYLSGHMDVVAEEKIFKSQFGHAEMVTKSAIGLEETTPYHIGTFTYCEGSGLYLIIGYETEADFDLISDLFEGLTYAGLGGKLSSGLGKFDITIQLVPNELKERLVAGNQKEGSLMSLSVALPTEKELENVINGAAYKIIKRSGFVASESYALENRKKKDLYVFAAGSVFNTSFIGAVYDVSEQGNHPVYRYAKPMMMGVSLCSHS